MTKANSLVEDSERFYNLIFGITGCSESLAERAADAIVEHLETAAAVLKDRLPADDRELVERLHLIASYRTDTLSETNKRACRDAADRISASGLESGKGGK